MKRKYIIWNADLAIPIGHKPTRKAACTIADALELRSGEHHVVVPA